MKTKLSALLPTLFFILLLLMISCSPREHTEAPFPQDFSAKLEWWKDARFGLFIHWGPVALNGTEISWSRGREISIEKYDSLYLNFNPVNFNADEWVTIAKEAGMKYIVLTTKHHDGFCLWDTRYTDYNIMNSPFKRDVVKELSEACKKQSMAFGTYYSTCDWYHPDFSREGQGGQVRKDTFNLDSYTEYLLNQSTELMENYGPLMVMWYDVPQDFDSIRGQSVIDRVKTVQPGIMVNDRTGAKGDFDTPEQRLEEFNNNRPWETCMTIGRQWAWKPNENLKSFEQCIHNLVRTVGGDGNLLFNVGPRPDGSIEPDQIVLLKQMGDWLKTYGDAVYGTRGGPFKPTDWGVSTRDGNKVFLHLLNWPENSPELFLPDIGIAIKSCKIMNGSTLNFKYRSNEVSIDLGGEPMQPVNTIVEIEYERDVMEIPPIEVKPKSFAYKKPVLASSNMEPHWSNRALHLFIDVNSIVNGDWSGDFWHPAEGDDQPWIEIDLESPQLVSQASLYEWGNNILAYELQYLWDGEWRIFYEGNSIGNRVDISFPPKKMEKIRLVLKEYENFPAIYETAFF